MIMPLFFTPVFAVQSIPTVVGGSAGTILKVDAPKAEELAATNIAPASDADNIFEFLITLSPIYYLLNPTEGATTTRNLRILREVDQLECAPIGPPVQPVIELEISQPAGQKPVRGW